MHWEMTGKKTGSSKEESIAGQQDDIKSTVHPLDIVTAVFLCADDFLRQELADKMAKCQYAVPFMLPLPHINKHGDGKMLLHWGLKSISRIFCAQGQLSKRKKKQNLSLVGIMLEKKWCKKANLYTKPSLM